MADDGAARSKDRLNNTVAITVALLATFLGVCKVKDDNICQAMAQAQADKLDHWAFYQARNLREEVANGTVSQLKLTASYVPAEQRPAFEQTIAQYAKLAEREAGKKEEVKAAAEADQKNYDTLNYRDDQFDLCDALIAVAISLLAVAALTNKWWLFGLALVPTGSGVVMGLAGLLGWQLHSDTLSRALS